MDAHDIRPVEERFPRDDLGTVQGGRDERVVGDGRRAERLEASGDLACDPPVADEPHHLARELPAVRAPLPATGFDRGDRRDEAAHEQEVERDRELRDTRRRGGRGVDDPDPALGGGAHVDVVDPDPGACDQRKRRRGSEEVGGDLRTAPDDHRRRPRQMAGQRGGVPARVDHPARPRAQPLERGGVDRVGDHDERGLGHRGPDRRPGENSLAPFEAGQLEAVTNVVEPYCSVSPYAWWYVGASPTGSKFVCISPSSSDGR